MRIAGIDIGTLTCRLLVAEIHLPHSFKEIDADRRILRLGEGVDQHKRLSEQSMDRVMGTLQEWKDKIAQYSLEQVTVVATSAVRESENRHVFVTRVKQEIGWDIEILTGEEEARRTLKGVRFGLPATISNFLGLDIGGGSTECILARNGLLPKVMSLDLGVVRLLERVFHHDPPTKQDLKNAEINIDEQLVKVKQTFGEMGNLSLVGTAGTITTLAAMTQGLKKYDRNKVHNYELHFSTIKSLEESLIGKTGSERLDMSGLEPGREYVIVAGTMILRRLMETFNFATCLVSDYGLREGILVDVAEKI